MELIKKKLLQIWHTSSKHFLSGLALYGRVKHFCTGTTNLINKILITYCSHKLRRLLLLGTLSYFFFLNKSAFFTCLLAFIHWVKTFCLFHKHTHSSPLSVPHPHNISDTSTTSFIHHYFLTLSLLIQDITCFCKVCRSWSILLAIWFINL